MPSRMLLLDLVGRAAVRNVEPPRAWSPAPSPLARPLSWAKPETTLIFDLKSANGWSVGESCQSFPFPCGVQSGMIAPFGKNTHAIRTGFSPFDAAAKALRAIG